MKSVLSFILRFFMVCVTAFAIFGLFHDIIENSFDGLTVITVLLLLLIAYVFYRLSNLVKNGIQNPAIKEASEKLGNAVDKVTDNIANDITETKALSSDMRLKKICIQVAAVVLFVGTMTLIWKADGSAGKVILGIIFGIAGTVLCFEADKIDKENLR